MRMASQGGITTPWRVGHATRLQPLSIFAVCRVGLLKGARCKVIGLRPSSMVYGAVVRGDLDEETINDSQHTSEKIAM